MMAHAVRDSGFWDQVRNVALATNINRLTGTIHGELAAEECFRGLATRGLRRHHALADALALRAAYVVVKSSATELVGFARTDDFRRLVNAAGGLEWESWTWHWLLKPARGLGRRSLDIAGDPNGAALLEEHLGRIGNG